MMYLKGIIICLILTGLISCKNETTKIASEEKLDDIESIDSKILQWQNELNVPNVGLGIIENGKITKVNIYGETESENMLFNIASVTKVVFTSLVLKLIENGDLDLYEPLHKYYVDPDIILDGRHKQLTPYTLLTQQSGFTHNWRSDHPDQKLTFSHAPGMEYNYSGEGMEYLRKAIEHKFNKSLTQLSDSLIFKPLSMHHTVHSWDGNLDKDEFSLAYNTEGKLHEIGDHSTIDSAADDLITTIDDLLKFTLDVLKKSTQENFPYTEMTQVQAVISPNLNQGLGWRLVSNLSNDEYAIQHGGNDIGVAAIIVILPKSKRGLVVLTNADNGALICNSIIRAVIPDVGTEIVHKSYKSGEVQEPIKTPKAELQKYAGNYIQPSGRKLHISTIENGLHLQMNGIPNLNFYAEKKDTFFSPDFDFGLIFSRNENGNIQDTSLSFEGKNMIKCKREY